MSESEVIATLEHEGKQYTVHHHNWSHPDPDADEQEQERLVWWMWVKGNYGCDCNRFSFIEDEYGDDAPVRENPNEDERSFACGKTVNLVGLTLDGKDLLAPTTQERLAAIGLVSL